MKQRHLLPALLLCALACDSANPVAPTGTVLSANANPTQIALNGDVSRITITGFKPDGNPLNPGTQINVTTTLGNLFDQQTGGAAVTLIQTTEGGQAIAWLRSDGRSGSAEVTATLTTGGEATATATVEIGETDASKPTLIISANPTTIAVRATSRISILGRNSDNTPVGQGERIRLTSDLGTVVEDGGGVNSPTITSVLTDGNGEGFATFVAADRGGTGQVSAILGTSDEVSVTIMIRDALNSLSLTANPQSIQRLDTGASVVLEAVLRDAQGEAVSSTLVLFETQFGALDNSSVLSNSQGVAVANLTVTAADVTPVGENETFRVTATATSEGETRSDFVDIEVQGSPNP